jgi:diadenylate cyclase
MDTQFPCPGLFIGIAIIFQPELRKIFMRLGQSEWFGSSSVQRDTNLESALNAAEILSRQKRGALLVFPRRTGIKSIVETGTRLNAELSSALIISIFAWDGPLHDGAVIIHNGKVLAAGCVLPLSEQQDIRKSFGTRHRAALGLSEETDAVVLIVSEETGAMSLAWDSHLYYDLSVNVLSAVCVS